MNYYIILGIERDASNTDIRDAYRRLVQKYHPDHYGQDSVPFLKIQEAYNVLNDPEQRDAYDQKLASQSERLKVHKNVQQAARPGIEPEPLVPDTPRRRNIEEISLRNSFDSYGPSFEEIFERFMLNFGHRPHQKSEHAESVLVEVSISREQARYGGSFRLMIPVQIACPVCQGTGSFGFWECRKCMGEQLFETEVPLMISYPSDMRDGYTKSYSLARFGIENYFLTVKIRISNQ